MMRGVRAFVPVALALLPPTLAGWWWGTTASGPRQELLAHVLYWLMPVYGVLAALAVVRWWRAVRPPAAQRRAAWIAACGAAALAATTVLVVGPRHRMQWDETTVLGIAQGMHSQRAALLTGAAVPVAGEVVPLLQTLDKRPPLFPFVVSVLHDVTGYRPANAFVANAIALGLALLVVALAAARVAGAFGAVTAPLLLLATPLTTVVATSAGLELLAATLLLLVLAQALAFVRAPAAVRAELLLTTGLLFAATRYEGLPVLLLVLGITAWQARGRWQCERSTVALLLSLPTLLTPLVLLLLHGQQDRFYPEANGAPLLAVAHLADHVGPWLAATFALEVDSLASVLAPAAVAAWVLRVVYRRSKASDWLVVAAVAAATTLTLAWFYGDVRELTAWRLYLPFAWFCTLSPLLLAVPASRWVGRGLLFTAAILATSGVEVVRRGSRPFVHPIARLTDAVERGLPALVADRATTVCVTSIAQHLIVHGYAALTPETFQTRWHELRPPSGQGEPREVLVLETPLDAAPAGATLRAVLAAFPSEVVHAATADSPFVVRRLQR